MRGEVWAEEEGGLTFDGDRRLMLMSELPVAGWDGV